MYCSIITTIQRYDKHYTIVHMKMLFLARFLAPTPKCPVRPILTEKKLKKIEKKFTRIFRQP